MFYVPISISTIAQSEIKLLLLLLLLSTIYFIDYSFLPAFDAILTD